MKAILFSILFLAISNLSSAQLVMNTSNINDNTISYESKKAKKTVTPKRTLKVIKKHNQSAAKQLGAYLNKELQYSQTMKEYCVEGNVIIEIILSNTGELVGTKVFKSPNLEVSKVVMEAMSNLKSIKFKNNNYLGNKKIRIPIDFTMR